MNVQNSSDLQVLRASADSVTAASVVHARNRHGFLEVLRRRWSVLITLALPLLLEVYCTLLPTTLHTQ